jgi:hypothetical protein
MIDLAALGYNFKKTENGFDAVVSCFDRASRGE